MVLLSRKDSCLLVIDIQERLHPIMSDADGVLRQSAVLMQAANTLDVPMLTSEQYPRGLGNTIPALSDHIRGDVIEKVSFSCAAEPTYMTAFEGLGKRQAVICGIESHICVTQTALELKDKGVEVFVVADATASRAADNHAVALDRLRQAGCVVLPTESVLFEWLRAAGSPDFKTISALIK